MARDLRTQVGRALAQLGIEHIAAYSPEARGRCERAFRTLQDRLPKELALAGITTTWRRRTASSARSTCRGTTRSSPSPRRERPGLRAGGRTAVARCAVHPGGAGGSAGQHRRLARRTAADSADIRRGRTSCGRRCGCMSMATASWPCSTARAAWCAGPLCYLQPSRRGPSREPLSRPAMAYGQDGQAKRLAHLPTRPAPSKAVNSSAPCTGQLQALATRATGDA